MVKTDAKQNCRLRYWLLFIMAEIKPSSKAPLKTEHFVALVCENQFLKLKIQKLEERLEIRQEQLTNALETVKISVGTEEDRKIMHNFSKSNEDSSLREIVRQLEKISDIHKTSYHGSLSRIWKLISS